MKNQKSPHPLKLSAEINLMSDEQVRWYYAKINLPIICKNYYDEFSSIHSKIEQYIYETGDVHNHASNVKATQTHWDTHKRNIHIGEIANKALSIIREGNSDHTIEMAECWGVSYKKGEHTILHNHFRYLWSFCYYVKVSENTSPLVLHNIYNPERNDFIELNLFPVPGDMVIFFGILSHSVPPSNTDEERIMIAGNIIKSKDPPPQYYPGGAQILHQLVGPPPPPKPQRSLLKLP